MESLLARDYINFEKVSMELGRLMDETPASFILMPFGNGFPQNDRIANGVAYANSKYWKKNLLLLDKLDVQSTLDICAAVDAAITTRLHAGIFSCIGETPFIDLTHHTKTQLFMEFIGKSDWSLDYWHFDYAAAKNLLHHFLNNKEQHRKEMSRININAKKLLYPLIDMQL
jgi:polysaccharide pyruvyl transferase WcaK-like protein